MVCIGFRSPAPPARPEMQKTAHRAHAPESVAEGSEDVFHEQDEMESVGGVGTQLAERRGAILR